MIEMIFGGEIAFACVSFHRMVLHALKKMCRVKESHNVERNADAEMTEFNRAQAELRRFGDIPEPLLEFIDADLAPAPSTKECAEQKAPDTKK